MTDRIRRWRSWLWDRQLAGDARAGSWARAEARRRQLRFLRDSWQHLTMMVAVAAVFIAGVAYLVSPGFWRGFIVGALGGIAASMLVLVVREVTGAAAVHMGSTAETWTASELRPLRKHGWRLTNRFLLGRDGDIDHLLVGPAGVVVAETKWRSSGWSTEPPDANVRAAAMRLQHSADLVRRWEPVKRAGCPVRPVLFLWGHTTDAVSDRPREYLVIDDVTVIRGTQAAAHWRERVVETRAGLSASAANELTAEIRQHLHRRDKNEALREPAPPSLERIYWTLCACLASGTAGMMALLEPLSHGLYWLAAVIGALGIGLGLYVRRYRSARLPADAWLAGLAGVGLLAIVLLTVM